MLLNIFSKMKMGIRLKLLNHEPGLYTAIIFPIAASFLLTFISTRILNRLFPDLYIPWPVDAHVHHYAYGFFILGISGYLALIFSGPRAKYYIALLHGFGLGLAFDEYGIWLNLEENDITRWSYDGLLIFIGFVFVVISAKKGVKIMLNHWPFKRSLEG